MKKFVFLVFLIGMFATGFAQDTLSAPFNYRLEYTPTGTVQNETDTVFTVKLIIENQSPESISKVHIKVFDSSQSNTVVINVNFNNPNSVGSTGSSYQIEGNNIEITLGNYVPYFFSYEVKIQDALGNVSDSGHAIY